MTRTVFFGKPTPKQKRMYQTVIEAQKRAIKYLHKVAPCTRCNLYTRHLHAKDVDKVARDYITSQGYPTIPHSLGHGIGIEVHEGPNLSSNPQPKTGDMLKEGMVFSIEPGIYIPGFGGVRIEDLVVLEASGPRILTKSKRHIIEL